MLRLLSVGAGFIAAATVGGAASVAGAEEDGAAFDTPVVPEESRFAQTGVDADVARERGQDPGNLLGAIAVAGAAGALSGLASGNLEGGAGGPRRAGRHGPLSTRMLFTRDDKCVFCQYALQQVETKLRSDPFLNYIGPPEDYPFKDSGSIFGVKDSVQYEKSIRHHPVPPIPRSERNAPIRGMGSDARPLPPPPPFVTPPQDRLLPGEIAEGKGRAQDSAVAIAQMTLAKAARSAMRTFAVPGANGNSFEGGLAWLAGKERPDILAPVDPNELLVPAGPLGGVDHSHHAPAPAAPAAAAPPATPAKGRGKGGAPAPQGLFKASGKPASFLELSSEGDHEQGQLQLQASKTEAEKDAEAAAALGVPAYLTASFYTSGKAGEESNTNDKHAILRFQEKEGAAAEADADADEASASSSFLELQAFGEGMGALGFGTGSDIDIMGSGEGTSSASEELSRFKASLDASLEAGLSIGSSGDEAGGNGAAFDANAVADSILRRMEASLNGGAAASASADQTSQLSEHESRLGREAIHRALSSAARFKTQQRSTATSKQASEVEESEGDEEAVSAPVVSLHPESSAALDRASSAAAVLAQKLSELSGAGSAATTTSTRGAQGMRFAAADASSHKKEDAVSAAASSASSTSSASSSLESLVQRLVSGLKEHAGQLRGFRQELMTHSNNNANAAAASSSQSQLSLAKGGLDAGERIMDAAMDKASAAAAQKQQQAEEQQEQEQAASEARFAAASSSSGRARHVMSEDEEFALTAERSLRLQIARERMAHAQALRAAARRAHARRAASRRASSASSLSSSRKHIQQEAEAQAQNDAAAVEEQSAASFMELSSAVAVGANVDVDIEAVARRLGIRDAAGAAADYHRSHRRGAIGAGGAFGSASVSVAASAEEERALDAALEAVFGARHVEEAADAAADQVVEGLLLELDGASDSDINGVDGEDLRFSLDDAAIESASEDLGLQGQAEGEGDAEATGASEEEQQKASEAASEAESSSAAIDRLQALEDLSASRFEALQRENKQMMEAEGRELAAAQAAAAAAAARDEPAAKDEKAAPAAAAAGNEPAAKEEKAEGGSSLKDKAKDAAKDLLKAGAKKAVGAAAKKLASKLQSKGAPAGDGETLLTPVPEEEVILEEEGFGEGTMLTPGAMYAERGKLGRRERARRAYRIAQQLRYQQLYHAFTKALEGVCKHDVPAAFVPECRPLYAFAERIADWMLHGYYVDEICAKVRLCRPGFFDNNYE